MQSILGGANITNFGLDPNPSAAAINSFLSPLRSSSLLNQAQITSYTYDPFAGILTMTDPKGLITSYEYDELKRLINIKDQDGNIVKHLDYHYQNQ